MTIVDANYKIIFVDVGCQGRLGDVFKNLSFYKNMVKNSLNLSPDNTLPDLDESSNSNFALHVFLYKKLVYKKLVLEAPKS